MKNERSVTEKQHEDGEQQTKTECESTTLAIISRKEAQRRGLTKYFTGKPCHKGHIAQRWTGDCACMMCAKEHRQKNRKKPKSRRLKLIHAAKYRCSKSKIEFDLSVEDVWIPENCPVLGIPINPGGSGFSRDSPSIDRKNPDKGYFKDNIEVISWRANKLKSDACFSEILGVFNYMARLEGLKQRVSYNHDNGRLELFEPEYE